MLACVGTVLVWLHFGRPDPHGHGVLGSLPTEVKRRCFAATAIVVVLFVRSLWLGLAGLHGRRWVACGAATLVAMAALAIALGRNTYPLPLGVHVVLHPTPGGWSPDLGD